MQRRLCISALLDAGLTAGLTWDPARRPANNAVTQLTEQAPETSVYLDAGNPGWISAATMAGYLNSAAWPRRTASG